MQEIKMYVKLGNNLEIRKSPEVNKIKNKPHELFSNIVQTKPPKYLKFQMLKQFAYIQSGKK